MEITETETLGEVGIDVNERNVTASDTSGITVVFDTSNVAELKERYRCIRSKIGRRTAGQANKPQTLRQIRNEGEESQHPGPPPGLEGNRRTGQREEAWHRHGEAERHQEAVSQRERSGSIFQRQDELVDVQRAS